jgi:hypothetical protein
MRRPIEVPDIHEILQIAKADGPPARHSVEDVVTAGRRRRRRAFVQRVGGAGVVGVALATAGVLTAVNLALPNDRRANTLVLPASPPAPTAPAPSPPFTFTFTGYRVDSYRVLAPDVVTSAYQSAGVVRDRRAVDGTVSIEYAGTLTVYQPKTFNPQPLQSGTRLTVQGRDAFQTEAKQKVVTSSSRDQYTFKGNGDGPGIATLAWQYAPDSWATLSGEGPSAFTGVDEAKVAEQFTVAAGGPVKAKVPFRTGYLPAGFTLQSIDGQSLTSQQRGMVRFTYAKPPAANVPGRLSATTTVVISILWVDTPPPDAAKRKSRCNPGQHFCVTTLPGGEFYFVVEDPSKSLPDAELTKVADTLTFAKIKDPNSWYTVP